MQNSLNHHWNWAVFFIPQISPRDIHFNLFVNILYILMPSSSFRCCYSSARVSFSSLLWRLPADFSHRIASWTMTRKESQTWRSHLMEIGFLTTKFSLFHLENLQHCNVNLERCFMSSTQEIEIKIWIDMWVSKIKCFFVTHWKLFSVILECSLFGWKFMGDERVEI